MILTQAYIALLAIGGRLLGVGLPLLTHYTLIVVLLRDYGIRAYPLCRTTSLIKICVVSWIHLIYPPYARWRISMSDYTNVIQLVQQVHKEFRQYLHSNNLMGVEPWTGFLCNIREVMELLEDPAINEPINNYAISLSLIDKMGMGPKTLELWNTWADHDVVSIKLQKLGVDVTAEDVKTWLGAYNDNPSLIDRMDVGRGSIFDTQIQMQAVFEKLHDVLEDVEHKEDDSFKPYRVPKQSVMLDYIKEIRMVVKDGSSLALAVANMQSVDSFKRIVIEEINQVAPDVAQKIWYRIKNARANHNSIDINM